MKKKYILPGLFFLILPLFAQSLHCTVCGKGIRGEYLASGDKVFCSQKCFEHTLPSCSVCGKKLPGQFLIAKNQKFCSKKCMRSILPKCENCFSPLEGEYFFVWINGGKKSFCSKCNALPRCFVCNFPTENPSLPDGRHVCRDCSKDAVISSSEAQVIAERLRNEINSILPRKCTCRVKVQLLDQQSFSRAAASAGTLRPQGYTLLGIFQWQERYFSKGDGRKYNHVKQERICILSHISRDRFMEVAAHELAHHWQHHLYPGIADHTVKEGFAEYVASKINLKHGNGRLNARMEYNPDPVYGGGYRMMKNLAKQNSWNAVLNHLASHQKR